jgi:hypothetical protein
MDQTALLSVIGSFYDKLVNDVSENVINKLRDKGALASSKEWTSEIDSRIKEHLDDFSDRITMMDRSAIEEIVSAHLEDLEVVTRQGLSDYVQEDDIADHVKHALRDEITLTIDVC